MELPHTEMLAESEGPAEEATDTTPEAPPYAEDEDILSAIADLERDGLRLRQDEESAWLEAWRFYNGKHWGTWTDDGRIIDIPDSDEMPRIVLNYIQNMVQTRLGHLIKNRPVLQGLPGTPDENARNATRLAVQAILAYWRKLKLPKKLMVTLLWTLVCGKCFWKIWWDPAGGREVQEPGPMLPMTHPGIETPMYDDAGMPMEQPGEPISRQTGELCIEVCYPHEILVSAGAMDLDSTQELLHTVYEPLRHLLDQGLIDDEEAKTLRDGQTSDEESTFRARRQLEALDRLAGVDIRGRVPVRELWLRPSDRYPQGLWAIVVNGKVRKKEPIPDYYKGAPPFVEFDELKTNGFWSTSTTRQLMDINRVIDIEISQQENQRRVLRYKTLVPEQANIDPDAFDRSDDEVINYWHPYVPTHLKPPEVNVSHVEIRNSLITMMKEVGGNWDVLAGKTQGEVRSGRQTAYLQEYAGTVLGVVSQQTEWSITKAGNMMLEILQACVKDEQLESFVGSDRRVQVMAFKGADLKGCTEIIVQPGSALPISRTERWDRIENWMEKQWLDPKVGLRLLDLGDYDQEIYGEEEQDRLNADENIWKLQALTMEEVKQAHQASLLLAQQQGNLWSERYLLRVLTIEAFPFDNHELHVKQLDKALRKTRVYRTWPSWQRALADALVEWHAMMADPMHGPIETPIGGMPAQPGASMPPGAGPIGTNPEQGQADAAAAGGGEPGKPGEVPATGGPQALKNGKAPGGGGVGGGAAGHTIESGAEKAAGLPGVPRPPGPGTA